jgi:hypothetical protein
MSQAHSGRVLRWYEIDIRTEPYSTSKRTSEIVVMDEFFRVITAVHTSLNHVHSEISVMSLNVNIVTTSNLFTAHAGCNPRTPNQD